MPSSKSPLRNSAARAALGGMLLATLTLAGCAVEPVADEVPHGVVEGASEAPEPQLALAELGADGTLTLRDLLTGETSEIASIDGTTTTLSTDGRFVFAGAPGSVTIVDTGLWTVDHGDHFHYYRGEPRVVGALTGRGESFARAGEALTTVRFAGDDEVRVLDSGALGRGELIEVAELEVTVAEAMPLGELVLLAGTDGITHVVAPADPTTDLATAKCPEPAGAIETRVGVAIGCADGAVLGTVDSTTGEVALEHIPYPAGTTPELRATEFDGRLGRPTVAAVAGTVGAWLLDTRERSWQLIATEAPLLHVAAVDDTREHVVGLTADGRVLVFDAGGTQLGASAPLLDGTLGTAAELGVELTVDAHRAYLNSPGDGVIHEIDYADAARIARTFESQSSFFAETGR